MPEASRYFAEGVALSGRGKHEEALVAYDQALSYSGDFPEAWYNKGTALGHLGQYQEAVNAFEHALRLNFDYFDAWYNKGVALGRLGRHQEALEAFEWILRQTPNDAKVWLGKGIVLLALQETEASLEALEKALAYSEDEPRIWTSIGVASARLGKFAEAQKAFQKAFEFREGPSDWGPVLYRAWAVLNLALGVNGLMSQNLHDFEGAGLAYIELLEKAEEDGAAQVVEDALTHFKSESNKRNERRSSVALEELELFISLMKIKDPFEGWRALSKEISKVWPKGVSAVQAVREMRR